MNHRHIWATVAFLLIFGADIRETHGAFSGNPRVTTEPESRRKRAELCFDSLKFDSAALLYRQYLNGHTAGDDGYFPAVNRCVEALWWQCRFSEAELLARDFLPQAIDNLGEDHVETGRIYMNLGILGFITGSTVMTEDYFQKAKEIFLRKAGRNHPLTATIYEWLGAYHESFNDRKNCYDYLNQARTVWLTIRPPDHPDLANVYRYLGLYHKRYAGYDSARYFFRKALHLFDKRYGPGNLQSVKCLNNECDLYEHDGDYTAALKLYQEALRRIGKASGEIRMVHAMTLLNLADFYTRQNMPSKALEFIQQVFTLFFPDFCSRSVLDNPVTIGKEQSHYYLLLAITGKSAILKEWYKSDPLHPVSCLKSALQCDSLVDLINRQIKKQIINLDNLLAFEQTRASWYYGFARNALQLHALTRDRKYLSSALYFMETNRNLQLPGKMALYDVFLQSQPALSEKFGQLQKEINLLKTKVLYLPEGKNMEELQRHIRDKKIALDQLYYSIFLSRERNSSRLNSVEDIHNDIDLVQRALDHETLLIEIFELYPDYIQNPTGYMVFAITRKAFLSYEIPGDSLTPLLTGFFSLISDPASPMEDADSVGILLYRKIFAPSESMLTGKTNLALIPSPNTWMIPVEVIPMADRPEGGHMIDYLTIRKEFSLLSWLDGKSRQGSTEVKVLAVAPQFDPAISQNLQWLTKRDSTLMDLPGSRRECEEIGRVYPTLLLTGKNVTKEEFCLLAPDYPMIHLSTHGVTTAENPDLPGLAFISGADHHAAESILSFYEILNLNLDATLITMSACRSAKGYQSRSEGNVNLAWAFRQAGAASFVVSLWDVNDYASSVIMPLFYTYLSEGASKPEALRKAKLHFLKTSDYPFHHPFYWSSFDYIGDDQAVGVGKDTLSVLKWEWIILILAVLLLPGLFTFLKRSKRYI